MKRSVGLALGIAIVVALFWIFGVDDLAAALSDLRPGYAIAYLSLAILVLLGYSLRWRFVARAVGQAPPLARLVGARLAGDAVGGLVPSAKLAGEPVRIALLRAGGIAGPAAGAGVAIDRLVEAMSNVVCVGAYAAVFWLARGESLPGRAPLVLASAVGAGLLGLAIPLLLWRAGKRPLAFLYGAGARRALPRLLGWLTALERTEDHLIGFLRDHPRRIFLGLLASLAIEALILVEYHFLLASFGIHIALPALLLVLLGTGVARLSPTPAGLGALEATQVGAIALAGGRPETGLVIGAVVRLHETFWMAAGLAALWAQGFTVGRLRASSTRDGAIA